MKGKFPNGLRAALSRSGVSQSALARAIQTSRQNVLRWVQEEQKIPIPMARRIAPLIKTSVRELLLLEVEPALELSVEGSVGAGGSIIDIDADISGLETIDIVAGEPKAAVKISGDSLGRFEGWFAIIGERGAFRDSLVGSLCVVETLDGDFLIKWLAKSKGKGIVLLSGDGTAHSEDAHIKWAAPVLAMRPPKRN